MVFHALTFARSLGRCWKPRPKAAVFNTSQGTWRILMHWKTMFGRYYCIKTENICYISRYFLHNLVSPFHRCLANAISTEYARSRVGQYTSHNGRKSVAPVRSYWKLRSRALTSVNCLVNTRLFAGSCTAVNNVRRCFLCNNNISDSVVITHYVVYAIYFLVIHLIKNMFILHMWYLHGFQAHITLVERKKCDNGSRGTKPHITTFGALGGLAFDSAYEIK